MEYTSVPASALTPCDKPGTLQRFTYTAHLDDGASVEKAATVYLPYGYDEAARYPVLYLMHGGGGDELEWFKNFDDIDGLKNVLDQSIASGRVAPMIVVTPTFMLPGMSTEGMTPEDFVRLTRRFPKELAGELIPALDAAYPTLADRAHRAFGGFSMGGETTWNVLAQTGRCVQTYLPLSGDFWAICMKGGKDYPVETVDALVAGMKATGTQADTIRILTATGDEDIAYQAMAAMIQEMSTRQEFTLGDTPAEGNLCFLCKPGGLHCYRHGWEYVWHLLPWLFQA